MAATSSPLPPDIAAQDKGPTILAVCITFTILSTLFVAARLFVRSHITGKLHLDDYLITLSIICGWATVGITIKAVSYGNGRHFPTLTPEQMSGTIKWTMIGFCPGVMSFGLPKLAVAALLTRLMNPSRWHAIFMWSIAVLCLVNLLGCVALLFGQCTPSSSMWDFSVKGECWSPWILVNYSIYAGTFSAFVDLYFAIYPAVVLFNLQMNLKKKLALACALGIGSVATVIAIYKTTRLPALASPDFTYDSSDLTVWTVIEGSAIIIASCIPVLKPLLDLVLGRRVFSSNKSYQRYHNYPSSRSGNVRSGIELSKSGGRSRNPNHRHGATKDPEAVEDSSICEASRCPTSKNDANDSQASILPDNLEPHPPPLSRSLSGGIVRTDLVTVTSTLESDAEGSRPVNRWEQQ